MDILILFFTAGVFLFLIYDKFFSNKSFGDFGKIEKLEEENKKYFEQLQRLSVELEQKNQKYGELVSELNSEKKERNEQIGKGKQMFLELTQVREKFVSLQNENDVQKKVIVKFETENDRRAKEFENKVIHLENSRLALEDEKFRIRREDEERLKRVEEERDRMWNEHEQISIIRMKEVCQKIEISFNFFDNSSLPGSFDGTLKPDFLVEFLGQYIIFDAKMSKSENLQNYINDQVKNTVKKIKLSKNIDEIYTSIFFIVPTLEIKELKKIYFFEGGFSFFVISIESFEPILAAYKKMREYDLAESFDPQDRENIVNLIAAYDFHINKRNSIDIISSMEGLKVSSLKNSLNKEMQNQIDVKKSKMRIEKFKDADMKRFIYNPEEQISQIKELVIPKDAEISKKDFELASNIFED